MPGTIRHTSISSANPGFLAALLATLTAVVMGCATSVRIAVDENEDFSHYRTWDWMPQIRPRVESPYSAASTLTVRMARLIEAELETRGFEHANPPADFYVTYHLTVERKSEWVEQPVAPYLLSSHHSSASYWVEGTEAVERRFDDFRLAMGISEGGGRMTWQAAIDKRVEASESLPLEAAVGELFDRFPASGPSAESSEQP